MLVHISFAEQGKFDRFSSRFLGAIGARVHYDVFIVEI
jgi:hypothetical protein